MAVKDLKDGTVGSNIDAMIKMHGTMINSPAAAKNTRFGLMNYAKEVCDILKAREDAANAEADKRQMDIEEEIAKTEVPQEASPDEDGDPFE